MSVDPYQEVAAAAAIRKAQIREWAARQNDGNQAVTILPNEPTQEEVNKVNNQGADVTLDGPANEDAVVGEEKPEEEVAAEDGNPEPEQEEVEDDSDASGEGASEEGAERVSGEADEDSDAVSRPAESANKGEWVAYRIAANGLTEDEANEQTKAQLIAID